METPQSPGGMEGNQRPSFRALTRSLVTVQIGDSEQEFVIHKELLCYYWGYFKGALSGNFKETTKGLVTLRGVRSKVFELFVELLYTLKLDLGPHESFYNISWEDFIQLYIFLDERSVVPKLKNTVIDCMVMKMKRGGPQLLEHQVNFVYENTNENSKLRSLLVDFWVFEEQCTSIKEHPDLWNESFLRDVACRWRERCLGESADPTLHSPETSKYETPGDVCANIHEHGDSDGNCFYDEYNDHCNLQVEIS